MLSTHLWWMTLMCFDSLFFSWHPKTTAQQAEPNSFRPSNISQIIHPCSASLLRVKGYFIIWDLFKGDFWHAYCAWESVSFYSSSVSSWYTFIERDFCDTLFFFFFFPLIVVTKGFILCWFVWFCFCSMFVSVLFIYLFILFLK